MRQITLKSINKSFGKLKVLENVNLEYNSGLINGIIGKNGVGKTTLLKCIADIISFEGEIILSNIEKIGFLPANPYMFPKITGKEFINFSLSAKKSQLDKKLLTKLSSLFDIPLKRYADEYSTGMLKKLHIITLLLQGNDLLILDEPFDGLDPFSSSYLSELLLLEKRKGKIIIMSSHNTERLKKISDTITLIEDYNSVSLSGIESFYNLDLDNKANKIIKEMLF